MQPTDKNLTGALLTTAYMYLLSLPHDETRLKMQPVLCAVRDEIARLADVSPQRVQDDCEANVARFGDAMFKFFADRMKGLH